MSLKNLGQSLYFATKTSRWSKGIGAELPEEYKKFWREWKLTEPAPVHYIKQEGVYAKNEKTGEIYPVQNFPIRLIYPKEINDGIWGGEAVIQGFVKKDMRQRRVARIWFPFLKKSVVYSEVLDKYMRVVVTNRTINLIHENYGFDHYLLKTPACDLRSELALKIKRQILLALYDKTLYPDDENKREQIFNKYQDYLKTYTREEVEWYGLNYKEACDKWQTLKYKKTEVVPLKLIYRTEFIKMLQDRQDKETSDSISEKLKKFNPFK